MSVQNPVALDDGSKSDKGPIIQILIGVIGILLIVFSLLLFWTAYNSFVEKKAMQANSIERILAREDNMRRLVDGVESVQS